MERLMINRLEIIRTLSCCQCYAPPPSQAAHSNWSEHGKGKGIKADDKYTIPLCHKCHTELDQYINMNRKQAKAWFMKHWEFINDVISTIQAKD